MEKNLKIFLAVIGALILGIILLVFLRSKTGDNSAVSSGKYDTFAQCLADKGAVFYGAFWCSHCNATKKMFGSSKKLLPYVECSTPDGNGQLAVCKEKKVESYPTWEFADGSRLVGEVSLETLSQKTSCPLPLAEEPIAK